MPMCVIIIYAAYVFNILDAFLKVVTWFTPLVLDMVLYLCVLVLFALMSLFGVIPTSEIT